MTSGRGDPQLGQSEVLLDPARDLREARRLPERHSSTLSGGRCEGWLAPHDLTVGPLFGRQCADQAARPVAIEREPHDPARVVLFDRSRVAARGQLGDELLRSGSRQPGLQPIRARAFEARDGGQALAGALRAEPVRQPVVDAALRGVEGGVRRMDRDAGTDGAQDAGLPRGVRAQAAERREDRGVVADDQLVPPLDGLVEDGIGEVDRQQAAPNTPGLRVVDEEPDVVPVLGEPERSRASTAWDSEQGMVPACAPRGCRARARNAAVLLVGWGPPRGRTGRISRG